jgi:ATP adenylyltransferase
VGVPKLELGNQLPMLELGNQLPTLELGSQLPRERRGNALSLHTDRVTLAIAGIFHQTGGVRGVSNEQLWAPWRLGYILGERNVTEPCDARELLPGADAECFLCRSAPCGDDRQRLVVHRGVHTVTLLNRYPYNNGHLLVAPQRHMAGLQELDDDVQLELSRTITQMVGLLEAALHPQGFNVGLNLGRAAGAGLPGHVHWHIVPRWIGDTNFMPTIAGVHTIPQSLEALWELLAAELSK